MTSQKTQRSTSIIWCATVDPFGAVLFLRHVSPTCRTDAGSGPPPLNSLTFRPVVGQLSEVVPCLLLEQGVEWPAKRCYVGFVAVGVQEQAEDILVPLCYETV